MTKNLSLRRAFFAAVFALMVLMAAPTLRADIRIVTWNISDYNGTNVSATDIRNVLFGTFQGRTMNPDIIIVQEFQSQTAVTNFLQALNTDPLNPTEWAAAPFINGPDTESEFFYRTSKFTFLGVTIAAAGSSTANATTQPRNTYRYDVQLKGYPNSAPVLACYAVHMKSGSSDTDQARRLVEASRIRTNAETLPAGWHFLMAGDTNIQSAAQAAYQELVVSKTNNAGRFFDPIFPLGSTPQTWNNNETYKFMHTQDPSGNPSNYGGMDDRLDMILLSGNLVDGTGLDYRGNPTVRFSTTTWNDPNHSLRAWGNDGTSFNQRLRVGTAGGVENAMVGAVIAQSLINAGGITGHLPVFLDLVTPAATANVSGAITLQSAPSMARLLTFVFTPTTGNAITRTVTPAANGDFSITGLPTGQYTLGIKGDKWLRQSVAVDIRTANAVGVNLTLPAGDVNNDNAVDITDLLLLTARYNVTASAGNYLEAADFNEDGTIDISDLLALIGNYNALGD
jgi:hypothetical protein